jgi:RimJ/RimL family protein N-acetyltransferase
MLGSNLEGERIRLRAPAGEDLSTFARWFADPEVTRYLLRRYPPSPAQEVGWLEDMARSEKDLVWAVVRKDGGLVVGVIGLHRIDWQHRHAWIEIVLGERSAWGKGYATEAMRLGADHAFHELGLEKVLASVYRGNERSIGMAEKLGYRQCGLLRRNAFFAGEWHDEWLGEILREDWSGPHRTGARDEPDTRA